MALINKPPNGSFDTKGESQNPGWANFWSAIFNILNGGTKSGPTASRPTANDFRWIGMRYFDTSLGLHGKPVYLAKDGTTWILADGTIA